MEGVLEKEVSKSQVHAHAEHARAHLAATGAVDSEPEAIRQILVRMDKGVIAPAAAKVEIDELLEARQDYH